MQLFQKKLMRSQEKLARSFCKNLIQFICGKSRDIHDYKIVGKIIKKCDNQYKARDLLTEVIKHYLTP